MPSNNFSFQCGPWQAQVRRVKQLQAVLLLKAASNLQDLVIMTAADAPAWEIAEIFPCLEML